MIVFVWMFPCSGEFSAEDKYRIFMRHRYNSCVEMLLEHLSHELYGVKVSWRNGNGAHTHLINIKAVRQGKRGEHSTINK